MLEKERPRANVNARGRGAEKERAHPMNSTTLTLRDVDPAVWAAAFAAAYDREFAVEYDVADIAISFSSRREDVALERIDVQACRRRADAAVLALHPEGVAGLERRMREAEALARGEGREPIGDRLARATVHPEALRPPMSLPEPGQPSAERLAHLEAAERAYLLAAGWIYHPEGARYFRNGVWEDGAPNRLFLTHARAMAEQRCRDGVRP